MIHSLMRIVATHALPELKEVREFVRTQHGAPVRERMKPQFETEHSRLHGELSGKLLQAGATAQADDERNGWAF